MPAKKKEAKKDVKKEPDRNEMLANEMLEYFRKEEFDIAIQRIKEVKKARQKEKDAKKKMEEAETKAKAGDLKGAVGKLKDALKKADESKYEPLILDILNKLVDAEIRYYESLKEVKPKDATKVLAELKEHFKRAEELSKKLGKADAAFDLSLRRLRLNIDSVKLEELDELVANAKKLKKVEPLVELYMELAKKKLEISGAEALPAAKKAAQLARKTKHEQKAAELLAEVKKKVTEEKKKARAAAREAAKKAKKETAAAAKAKKKAESVRKAEKEAREAEKEAAKAKAEAKESAKEAAKAAEKTEVSQPEETEKKEA